MSLFETVPYEVLEKHKNIELRKYETFYVASTKTRLDSRLSGGFNNVFNYISGQNEEKEKISMTVPVVSRMEEDQLVTSFIVPSKYHGNIPQPSSSNVYIEEVREGIFISIRFSGAWTEENFLRKDKELKEYINEHNIVIENQRYIMRYQGPFVPSFLRRNEVLYRVKDESRIDK